MFMLNYTNEAAISELNKDVLDKIFNNSKLKLRDEDQLLNIINRLYSNNSNYSYMYNYIEFDSVSDEGISSFMQIYDYNHNNLTSQMWNAISDRIGNRQSVKNVKINRYSEKNITYYGKNEFHGIFYFIRKLTNDIDNEIDVTASSIGGVASPKSIITENKVNKGFYTLNSPNQWIRIEFKNIFIIPTYYSLKVASFNTPEYPKSWVIEGSIDRSNWIEIDKRVNCQYLNGKSNNHTFAISKNIKIKYFKIRQIGPNWSDKDRLEISDIEIYGEIINNK